MSKDNLQTVFKNKKWLWISRSGNNPSTEPLAVCRCGCLRCPVQEKVRITRGGEPGLDWATRCAPPWKGRDAAAAQSCALTQRGRGAKLTTHTLYIGYLSPVLYSIWQYVPKCSLVVYLVYISNYLFLYFLLICTYFSSCAPAGVHPRSKLWQQTPVFHNTKNIIYII